MKKNENLVLIGTKLILVPYKEEHVLKYHEWMQSPFLQEMTASEPLTLEEEYAMQRSWHEDPKKCTFIILSLPSGTPEGKSFAELKSDAVMVGDVNIFLNDPDNDMTFGEIEIMIAEEAYRRNGLGLEALMIMMGYAITQLDLQTFHAKISLSNQPSIDLFTRKLGYYPVSVSKVFEEMTLEWTIRDTAGLTEDEDAYGAKRTKEQEQVIQGVHSKILGFWESKVRKDCWK